MNTSLKILGVLSVVIAAVVGWFGMDVLNNILPRGAAFMVNFVAVAIAAYFFLKWIITEAVASGVEKGIKAVLTNSDIMSEISAAIAEGRESQSEGDEE